MTHNTDVQDDARKDADASDGGKAKVARDIEMIVAWVSFLALIIVMALAQCGVLVHVNMNDERQRVYSWFAAERYVQLIWVPVYLLLTIWLIRIGNGRKHARKLGHTRFTLIGVLFIATCLVGIGWVFAWAFKNYPSAVPLIGIQTLLVWALWFFSRREDGSFWGWAPFSLWGAWLVVETVTDLARAVTYYVSKDGTMAASGQSVATIALALVLFALACFARFKFDDWLFGLVVLWSMIGVALHLMDVSKFTAVVVIALAAVCAVFMYIPWKRVSGRLDAIEPRKPQPTASQREAAHEVSTPHVEDYDAGAHGDTDTHKGAAK